jgi:hypothetical protein
MNSHFGVCLDGMVFLQRNLLCLSFDAFKCGERHHLILAADKCSYCVRCVADVFEAVVVAGAVWLTP